MAACRELETDFGLRNGADTEKRDLKAEPGKVDVSAGDIRHQIGSTLKAVLEGYRFQSFGEYSALLSAFNIEAGLVKGEYKGVPYTGIVYSATDGRARVVSPPFKSSRFGKRFGYEGISKGCSPIRRISKRADGLRTYSGRWRKPCAGHVPGKSLWKCWKRAYRSGIP